MTHKVYKSKTTHPDFGSITFRKYRDGEFSFKQYSDILYLTREQLIELHQVIKEELNMSGGDSGD